MAIGLISKLKKSKQRVTVIDAHGNEVVGRISHWDDTMFSVVTADDVDVFFPINFFSQIQVRGGLEKREPLEQD